MITISPVNNEYRLGFIVEGHAGYAERGQDIVCASVSVLAQAVGNYLESRGCAEVERESGYISVSVIRNTKLNEHMINMFLETVELIESEYNEHVHIVWEDWKNEN